MVEVFEGGEDTIHQRAVTCRPPGEPGSGHPGLRSDETVVVDVEREHLTR